MIIQTKCLVTAYLSWSKLNYRVSWMSLDKRKYPYSGISKTSSVLSVISTAHEFLFIYIVLSYLYRLCTNPKAKLIWTATSENGPYDVCTQRRLIRACASELSNQSSMSPERATKNLSRQHGSASWLEFSLSANVKTYIFARFGSFYLSIWRLTIQVYVTIPFKRFLIKERRKF